MAKSLVQIKTMNEFGNKLAQSIRNSLRISKQLSKPGIVRLGKVTSPKGRMVISIEIGGQQFKDRNGNPIDPFIRSLESGAEPHIIKPRRKKRLAFFWSKARPPFNKRGRKFAGMSSDTGKLLFFYVEHPGMSGKHPIEKAIDRTLARATDELANNIMGNISDFLDFSLKEVVHRK